MTRPPESLFNKPLSQQRRTRLEAEREQARLEEIRAWHAAQVERTRQQPRWTLPKPRQEAA